MQLEEAYNYVLQSERRKHILLQVNQPVTANQLSNRLHLRQDNCSYVLYELKIYRLVRCLNPQARKSRLYWLTDLGKQLQKRLCSEFAISETKHTFPDIDWTLYGNLCFNHRANILKVIDEPLQACQIPGLCKLLDAKIRISSNNVRDVLYLFLRKGIVSRIYIRKKAHPRYDLTDLGKQLQLLLFQAEVRVCK